MWQFLICPQWTLSLTSPERRSALTDHSCPVTFNKTNVTLISMVTKLPKKKKNTQSLVCSALVRKQNTCSAEGLDTFGTEIETLILPVLAWWAFFPPHTLIFFFHLLYLHRSLESFLSEPFLITVDYFEVSQCQSDAYAIPSAPIK